MMVKTLINWIENYIYFIIFFEEIITVNKNPVETDVAAFIRCVMSKKINFCGGYLSNVLLKMLFVILI